jgi:hypothetical protein
MITLTSTHLIASGVERHVYRHPDDPRKLLKILRPQEDQGRRFTFRDITTHLMPSVRLRLIRKEYNEYLRQQLKNIKHNHPLPIANLYGFTPTNLGLAMMCECISDGEGNVGQTLQHKANNQTLTQQDLLALNTLVTQFYDLNIRAGDLKPHNLVFGERGMGYECVLVDGLGDIHAIPIRSWGKWFNHQGLNEAFQKAANRTGLIWVKPQRQFMFATDQL